MVAAAQNADQVLAGGGKMLKAFDNHADDSLKVGIDEEVHGRRGVQASEQLTLQLDVLLDLVSRVNGKGICAAFLSGIEDGPHFRIELEQLIQTLVAFSTTTSLCRRQLVYEVHRLVSRKAVAAKAILLAEGVQRVDAFDQT